MAKLVKDNKVNYIVHLAGILSALGEKNPDLAIDVNVFGAVNALRVAKNAGSRIFIPSTIGVFGGDHFPKHNTPNDVVLQPKTIYGVGKVFNENAGAYYKSKFGVDFRSLRYPGVISSEKFAFNGTTDYSTEIFFDGLEHGSYTCPLKADSALPMIYIDDCIDATVQYLSADPANLNRTVYNLDCISLVTGDFCADVQRLIPDLEVEYKPDFRQEIADSWPRSLDGSECKEWGWSYDVSSFELANKILDGIDDKYKTNFTPTTATSAQATPTTRKMSLAQ